MARVALFMLCTSPIFAVTDAVIIYPGLPVGTAKSSSLLQETVQRTTSDDF